MPSMVMSFRILLASPGDTKGEREAALTTIAAWNRREGADKRIALVPILWEDDSYSTFGVAPQTALDRQIVLGCDAAIAIFNERLGTPTEQYPGGAVQEIGNLVNLGRQVFLFFRESAKVEDRLLKFKKSIQRKALHTDYSDVNDFSRKLMTQLTSWTTSYVRVATSVTVEIGPSLARISGNPAVAAERMRTWVQRSLYFGPNGAHAWIRFVQGSKFEQERRRIIERKIGTLFDSHGDLLEWVTSVVSFGPGDGYLDGRVVKLLQPQAKARIRYLPVDISDGLLCRAIGEVEEPERVVGLLCDFEEDHQFLAERINFFRTGPAIFTMFGNTLGNLDQGELSFLNSLRLYMKAGDLFVLEVEAEPYEDGDKISPITTPRMLDFLLNGALLRHPEHFRPGRVGTDEPFDVVREPSKSDVPGGQSVRYVYRGMRLGEDGKSWPVEIDLLRGSRYQEKELAPFIAKTCDAELILGADDAHDGFLVFKKR